MAALDLFRVRVSVMVNARVSVMVNARVRARVWRVASVGSAGNEGSVGSMALCPFRLVTLTLIPIEGEGRRSQVHISVWISGVVSSPPLIQKASLVGGHEAVPDPIASHGPRHTTLAMDIGTTLAMALVVPL